MTILKNSNFALASILLFLGFSGKTQITITQADIMVMGTKIEMFLDTNGPALDFSGTGTGQTWDFSNVTVSMQYNSDILSPSGLIKSSAFPSATAALERFGINTQYYENTPTEIRHLGTVVSVIDTQIFRFDYAYLKYPASLGSKHKDESVRNKTYAYVLGFDPDMTGPHPFVDSVGSFSIELYESDIVAEGSVKTPEGNFNALKQYNKITDVDSAYMYANGKWQPMSAILSSFLTTPLVQTDTTHAFAWLANGMSLPVMTIEYDPLNNNKILAAQWSQVGGVGIKDSDLESALGIFPNPVSNILTLTFNNDEVLNIRLLDVNGSEIQRGSLHREMEIDMASLEGGIYYLHVENDKNSVIKKIIKL